MRAEHSGSIYSVSVSSPEPCLLATAGDDETVRRLQLEVAYIWHLEPVCPTTLPPHHDVGREALVLA